jgi:RNA polymerase sigma factor (sigma-70 family)
MQTAASLAQAASNIDIRAFDKKLEKIVARFAGSGVPFRDLMHEGRIALWEASQKWRGDSSLWTYAQKFILAAMLRAVTEQVILPTDEDIDSVPAEATTNEVIVFVREILDSLSPRGRAVVLRWMAGETFEEIAQTLDRSDRDIRRTFQAAIATLKERTEP